MDQATNINNSLDYFEIILLLSLQLPVKMTSMKQFSISVMLYIFLLNLEIYCIWPPAYKVNLTDEETFEIFDALKNSDVQDVYDEEELIKREDLEKLGIKSHPEKYFRIHHSLRRKKKDISTKDKRMKKKVFETFNPDSEYSLPWKGGFVNEEGSFIKDEDVIYFNQDAIISEEHKEKRDDKVENKDENYDYSKLKQEYKEELKTIVKSNETLNYTDTKEEESLKESVRSLIKKPLRNCTDEEKKGIGILAIECLLSDLNKPRMKNQFLEKLVRIVAVWFAVYLIIAIPCWCQYGWCCCCFRCKFCQPREEIEEVKRYFTNNPPGIFHDKDNKVFEYQPTFYEKYAHKKLEQELRNL
ncbi:uncharacterized protein [Leptinotarsa decemlineata]|uniref:uncharacterized protein n=1 Tax=Leptinotarsa decemlineata TaxID=7539 RepID=UPI003D30869B